MKYYIPVIGWLIAVYEYEKVYRAYKRGGPSYATWAAFDNTMKAFVPTMLFLFLSIIAISIISSLS